MKEGRFGEIRNLRNEAVRNFSNEDDKKDQGLIRKEVTLKSKKKDERLPPEEKEEISERMIQRYFLSYGVSKDGKNTCVDAIHSQMANTGEVVRILKRKPEWENINSSEIINKEVSLNEEILFARKNSGQGRNIFSIINELLEKYKNDELAVAILKIKKIHEDYLNPLVLGVAEKSKSSYYIAKKTRRFMDANRPQNTRRISEKNTREEFGHGYYEAQKKIMSKFVEKNENELLKPFLHISLHGKSDEPGDVGDVIISNGLRDKKMPCDPQIARWFSDRLNYEIQQKGLVNDNNEYFSSGVAKEGDRFCGNIVHTKRRFGDESFDALGENYQYIQVELSLVLREKYLSELQDILSVILEEFQNKFKRPEDLKEFLKKEMTEEDEIRLEGKIYTEVIYSSEVPINKIQLSNNYCLGLGVKTGEKVLVNKKKFMVENVPKGKDVYRKPILNDNVKFDGRVIIEKME